MDGIDRLKKGALRVTRYDLEWSEEKGPYIDVKHDKPCFQERKTEIFTTKEQAVNFLNASKKRDDREYAMVLDAHDE